MNQAQLKYARQRAEEIRAIKFAEINKKYTTPATILSEDQRIEALKKGEFTIVDKPSTYANWTSRIKFNAEVKGGLDLKAASEEQQKVHKAFTKLMDELMLGDNEQALKLLAAFEAA